VLKQSYNVYRRILERTAALYALKSVSFEAGIGKILEHVQRRSEMITPNAQRR
jgi:hypothetical protein